MKESSQKISKEMTIEEIFSTFPGKSQHLAQELTNAGLHCVGCHAATFETLEVGMLGHGFEEEAIDRLVASLNQIVNQEDHDAEILLTERAAKKFLAILKEEKKEGFALRFGDKPGGCGEFEYVLDFSPRPEEEDCIFHSHGVDIHVHQTALPRLIGSQIDYVEGLMGAGFKVINPRVKGSCNCGQSHSY